MSSQNEIAGIVDAFSRNSYLYIIHHKYNFYIIYDMEPHNKIFCRIPKEYCIDKDNYYFIGCSYYKEFGIDFNVKTDEYMQEFFNRVYLSTLTLLVLRLSPINSKNSKIFYYHNKQPPDELFVDGTIEYLFGE